MVWPFVAFLHLAFIPTAAAVSSGCWTWEGGSKTTLANVSSTPTNPWPRCCSQSWTLGDDTAVMFGGAGEASGMNNSDVFLADMWKFDGSSWTAMPKSSSMQANFAGAVDIPSARNYAPTWSHNGNLYMWGGVGVSYPGDTNGSPLNDTWMYSVNSQKWKKISTPEGHPPPRTWANFWSDGEGGVYIHGGSGGMDKAFSDLWHFSSTTMKWRCVYTYTEAYVNYNGAAGPVHPGARSNSYTTVTKNGLFVLVGGEGRENKTIEGDFQDVWTFDTKTLTWQHIAGPEGVRPNRTHYGTKGKFDGNNVPPAEHAGYILREPFRDALWFFAGENGHEVEGLRNDLWTLDLQTSQWAWIAGYDGYNGTASYGLQKKEAMTNTPGSRYAGQAWVTQDKLWIFGGYGFDANGIAGYLNDLWSFSTACQ